ncbi:MAG TPA: hypothetical protein VK468_01380 [Pyrinomonadaceae bacterium]|nr:hypothetical protein [Pyrinomonadaceae bacterium]
MNDLKNISIAWASTVTSVCTAIEAKTLITIISAVVLPIIFFAIGKTIDVWLQLRLRRQQEKRHDETERGLKP